MKRTVLLMLMLIADSAWAGHQQNPLPIYTQDNTRYELFFSSEGVQFQGQLYETVSRNLYRVAVEPSGSCPTDQPGRQTGEIRRQRDRYVWTWTEFVGCGQRARTIWRTTRREFSVNEVSMDELCTRAQYVFQKGTQETQLVDHCDGTLTLTLGEDTVVLSQRSRGRYTGKTRVVGEQTRLLQWSVRWLKSARRIQLRGSVRIQAPSRRTVRLRGSWTQIRATPLD